VAPGRVVVVGAGIIGTMHAWTARRLGYDVVHLDRDLEARRASVRNFGLIWVGGRAGGSELDLALRSRSLWDEVAADVPEVGLRPNGSLTMAATPEEMAVLEEAAARSDAGLRGWELLTPDEARARNPALAGQMVAALWCRADAAVEPRRAASAIRARLMASDGYQWLGGRAVMELQGAGVRDQTGAWHHADRVILCPGASDVGLGAELSAGAPLRRVRLQMMQTAACSSMVTTSVADGDSLRYYPAYDVPSRSNLPPQSELAASSRMQLLMVQRLDGSLTIGDTHQYEEPFGFDLPEDVYEELGHRAAGVLGGPLPPIVRRWAGVYSEVTDGSLYLRRQVGEGAVLVTGPGGRGMTMSAAIAEETFK